MSPTASQITSLTIVYPAQMAINAENVSIWRRHHEKLKDIPISHQQHRGCCWPGNIWNQTLKFGVKWMLLSKPFNHYFISSWHFTIFRATFSLCVNYFSFFATTLWMNWKFAIHFNSVSMCHFVVLSLKNMIYFRGWIPMAENDQTGVSFPTLILCSKARLTDIIYMNIYVVYIVIYLCELKFVFMVPIHNKSKLVWFRWDGRGISYPNPMTHIHTI